MKLMKTAEEMMQFCVENETGYDSFKDRRHFKAIEDCLQADEYALVCFEGAQLVDRAFHSIKDREYSFALTNKRLVMGQRSRMGDDMYVIWYKDLRGLELINDSLVVDSMKSWPCIQIFTDGVPFLRGEIPRVMSEINQKKAAAKVETGTSPADEIRKYKGLRDDGIITEGEFRKKKGQLLDGGGALGQTGMDAEVAIAINPEDYKPADEGTAELDTEKKAAVKQDKTLAYCVAAIPAIILAFFWLIILLSK